MSTETVADFTQEAVEANGVLDEQVNVNANQFLEQVRAEIARRKHRPTSTYRLQFNRTFTFNQGREQVAYLDRLGISDLYASPYFRARADSMHGYDICDHNSFNPSIGTPDEYNQMVEELHKHGLHQVLDTVPNHMGIGETTNTWWMDVLENGRAAVHAPYFDIDWKPLKRELTGKVLLPILGDQYGNVLERGEFKLRFEPQEGRFYVNYWEHVFPISPRLYLNVLELALEELKTTTTSDSDDFIEYQSIMTALGYLPRRYEVGDEKVAERDREKEVIKRRLSALCGNSEAVCNAIQNAVVTFNGTHGDAQSFNLLHALLEEQSYRFSYWRVASEEINYRRFFDVNDLAAIRVDQPVVFEETHRNIFRLIREGKLDGLRIDHLDGLRNPQVYLQRLQRRYFQEISRYVIEQQDLAEELRQPVEDKLLELWDDELSNDGVLARPLYVIVEKILGRGESLPSVWETDGTSGYEFTNAVNGLFVDGNNEKAFTDLYRTFIGSRTKFADMVYDQKKVIMRQSLASEINVLTNQLNAISESYRTYRDFTLSSLRNAIREVIACFPVYRTYVNRQQPEISKADRANVETAVARAKKRNSTLEPSVFDFLRDILLLNYPEAISDEDRTAQYNFVMKFQQASGPVMAKGLEDTAFYIYNRLISLNEVGGEPEHFGLNVTAFHRQQAERQRNWPYSMLTTSTHDTKRSEDVRARISVLSELPAEWRKQLTVFARLNRRKKTRLEGQDAPDRNEEYFIYQTLLGMWPFEQDLNEAEHQDVVNRLKAYLAKALNEAKVHTSWINENQEYIAAVQKFIEAILDPKASAQFLTEFKAFQKKIAHYGALNSLAQVLLKTTSPGLPDIYQGNEIWDLSLVDPDNRRPVDYDLRSRLLSQVEKVQDAERAAEIWQNKEDGRAKLFVTSRALNYRRQHPDAFEAGSYTALEATGPRAENIVAFSRSHADQEVIVVVPRLLAKYDKATAGAVTGDSWADSFLTLANAFGQTYRNVLTGETVTVSENGLALSEIFASFPVALLEKI